MDLLNEQLEWADERLASAEKTIAEAAAILREFPFNGTAQEMLSDIREAFPSLVPAESDAYAEEDFSQLQRYWDPALELFEKLMHPETQTYEAYCELFDAVSDETIRAYYDGALALQYRPYTNPSVVALLPYDDKIYLEIECIRPNENATASFPMFVRFADGKFLYTSADVQTSHIMEYVYVEDAIETLGVSYIRYLASKTVGANTYRYGDLTYVDKLPMIRVTVFGQLYAYQTETGDLVIAYWIRNGTTNDRTLKTAQVRMTDGETVICDTVLTLPQGTVIPSLDGGLVELTVPAADVLTGTAPWANRFPSPWNGTDRPCVG